MKKIAKITATICALCLCVCVFGCGNKTNTSKDASNDSKTESTEKHDTVQKGDNISVNYKGTLEDGTQFDSSYDRGQTLDFEAGAGKMIAGFDQAVIGMKVGEKKTVTLKPSEAYGEYDESKVYTVAKSDVKQGDVKEGSTVLAISNNQQIQGKVTKIDGDKVTIDANHELAGKTLIFEIELVSIK